MSASLVSARTPVACGQVPRTSALTSAVYEGTVRHRRFAVRAHEFRHRLALAYLDLDELPTLLGGRLVAPRPGPVRFRRHHYLGDEHIPLAQAVRDAVATQTGVRPSGPIRLLANLSSFGHCFNPVSFYYCMNESGTSLQAVLAEVTSTPWGERHAYVLEAIPGVQSPSSARGGVLSGSFPKQLHVSPFMGMDHRYEWHMTAPARTLSVHISSSQGPQLAFDATLSLRRRELTSASLARLSATTLRTLASIYTQAALLKLKGVPVHPHAKASPA
jgi:DUF1365 family protein